MSDQPLAGRDAEGAALRDQQLRTLIHDWRDDAARFRKQLDFLIRNNCLDDDAAAIVREQCAKELEAVLTPRAPLVADYAIDPADGTQADPSTRDHGSSLFFESLAGGETVVPRHRSGCQAWWNGRTQAWQDGDERLCDCGAAQVADVRPPQDLQTKDDHSRVETPRLSGGQDLPREGNGR